MILEYIIKKKNEYSRQLKEYERLKKCEEDENALEVSKIFDNKVTTFLKTENNIVSKFTAKNSAGNQIYLKTFYLYLTL